MTLRSANRGGGGGGGEGVGDTPLGPTSEPLRLTSYLGCGFNSNLTSFYQPCVTSLCMCLQLII